MTSTVAKVGILIRTKNRRVTLDQALRGLVCQTFRDWHIRLLNDGGDEAAVLETVARYKEALSGRISIYTNEKSAGRGGALAQLLNYSREDYILIHDDDDTIEPEFLVTTIAVLDDERNAHCCAVVTSNYDVHATIDGQDIRVLQTIASSGKKADSYVDFMDLMKARFGLFTTNSCLFRRKAAMPYTHIIPNMNYHEDKTLFKYMMLEGDFKTIEPHLSSYYHYQDVKKDYDQTNSFNESAGIIENNHNMREAIKNNDSMSKFSCMLQDSRRNKDLEEILVVTVYKNLLQATEKKHEEIVNSITVIAQAFHAINAKIDLLERKILL
ncbi:MULTISPECIES: glycosyltransferase family A protein [Asaia]|uniref:glycosyltransferase family A protein n=1 Tax=Asaia TaxID=91914 RepID=UPI002FC2C668